MKPALIVIGGSAGALEVVRAILASLPGELDVPIAIVLHIPRNQPNRLAEVLAAACARPVREAQDKEPAATGVVYLAPRDYHLLVDTGPTFALSVDPPVNYSQPSIDVLFESAADALGPAVIGLLLSGANADGARGLQAIKAAGGQVLAQDTEEAMLRDMPDAARKLIPGLEMLPYRDMCTRLVDIVSHEELR